MDWFEHLTGINPDGGSGTLEALIVIAIVTVVAGQLARLLKRGSWNTDGGDNG